MFRVQSQAQQHRLVTAIARGDTQAVEQMLDSIHPWLAYHGGVDGTVLDAALGASGDREAMMALLVSRGLDVSCGKLTPALDRAVERALRASGETWRWDARRLRVRKIVISGGKAWGLTWMPGDGQAPFLYGGGYDGAHPATAQAALETLNQDLVSRNREMARGALWFRPTLFSMVNGEGIDLEQVIQLAPSKHSVVYG